MASFISASVKISTSDYQSEIQKCRSMKVSKYLVSPIISEILFGITEDKKNGETLKDYAMRKGMTEKSFEKHFSEYHETKAIRENPDNYNCLDQTLKFKCIQLFKDFNTKLADNISLKDRIDTQMYVLKSIRNNKLCHNRETVSGPEWHGLADSMQVPLVNLVEIIKKTWVDSIDIAYEERQIQTLINQIMRDPLKQDEFRYMCLQMVIKFVAEPFMYSFTKLICNDKTEDTYEEYIVKRVMRKREYKDLFCSEEKTQLRRKSWEMTPDLKLSSKIIMVCKACHFKQDTKAKEELDIIIGNIRSIRNRIYHKMLSMTEDESKREAQNLGNCLTKLGYFAQEWDLYDGLDVAKINITQSVNDINAIMSLPYP